MNHIDDEEKLLKQIMTLIEYQFGSNCEVVLHDLTGDYEHTIVDIRNGHITNRKVGGCGSDLGLEVLGGNVIDGNRYNYITTSPDGKILRSSSIYFNDDQGHVIGSLCVNLDITETLRFNSFLQNYNRFDNVQNEFFAKDVNGLLEYLIQQAKQNIGREPQDMDKKERVEFLKYLDQHGAFQISKSSVYICELLSISKFTLYNDLEQIRAEGGNGDKASKA
ncbi:MAG: transcriptional regulator [Clostridiales bacterium]|nr:transcriptional regulator [Clostridiales bacterium]